jgi:hypothetical protein
MGYVCNYLVCKYLPLKVCKYLPVKYLVCVIICCMLFSASPDWSIREPT